MGLSKEEVLKPKLKINYKVIKDCIFESTFDTADKVSIDLMKKMLCANPKKRINIDKVLLHPYLSPFCFFIKSKSVLNKSKLYNSNSFEQINNLFENKTQLKNIFVSLNNVPYLKVIKHDNTYSIILSINSYFLSSKKNILRKIEENDIEKMDESDNTNEDSESNEEIFEEIKNNVS